jgi:hypothetical protein
VRLRQGVARHPDENAGPATVVDVDVLFETVVEVFVAGLQAVAKS